MKRDKGITLISLIGYVILSLMVISVLIVITSNFKNNFDELNVQSVHEVELDKINLQITKEIKDGYEINKNATSSNTITFVDGNVYTYVAADQTLYQNDNIAIAEHIINCSFTLVGDNVLRVTAEVENKTRTMEYTVVITEI